MIRAASPQPEREEPQGTHEPSKPPLGDANDPPLEVRAFCP